MPSMPLIGSNVSMVPQRKANVVETCHQTLSLKIINGK
jgi:hypothetical protein